MAAHHPQPVQAPVRAGLRSSLRLSAGLLPLLVVAFVALNFRPSATAPALPGSMARTAAPDGIRAAAGADPRSRLNGAAAAVEAALGNSGHGFSFQVVSRSTLVAKPGGPKIEVPDPIDPQKTLGLADEYYVGASIAEGVVTPNGYFLQMRKGPDTKDAAPDFVNAERTLAALIVGGKTYRNDGDGWYETDSPPGIGLDRRTAALLPKLLRESTGAVPGGPRSVRGQTMASVRSSGKVADAPGLMGIDAEAFTEFVGPIDFAIDGTGKLAELHVVMRNTRQEVFDLLVDTVVTFDFGQPGPLPEPVPGWSPPPPPSDN